MNIPGTGQMGNPAFWHRLSGALTNPTYRLYLAGTLGQFAAMTMNGSVVVNWEKCMGCGVCVGQCTHGALTLARDERKGIPLDVRSLAS